MASASSTLGIVSGRVDRQGRLVAADPPLAALQHEAGATIGTRLALPQIAAIARLARQLGVPVARPAIAAGDQHDYDLWVRATLEGDEVLLAIEGWRERAIAPPRLDLILAHQDDGPPAGEGAGGEWSADSALILTGLGSALAERLGVDPAEAIGQPLTRLIKLEEDEQGTLPILAALAARTGFADQPAVGRGEGATRLLLSAEPAWTDHGEFAGFTGRMEAEASLGPVGHGAQSAKGRLDEALRSPLDQIISAADHIVERGDGPLRSDYASYARDIAGAARHLMSVVQTMSDGVMAALPSAVDLVGAASEAVALVAARGEDKRIAVDVMAPTRVQATGERRAVVQIVVNILGNAIRHSPPGGVVTISIAEGSGRALLTIADTGPGISAQDQERIFDRFERLGSSTPDGTGLGLAIARRLARSLSGDIVVDSEPGEGARFTLDLPLA